tara:strand:+ start:206 stop:493 length:288 start_codon:yes stop_codon:yes gene_type:complete
MGMTEDEFDNMKNAAVSDAGDAYDKALEDGVPKPEAASTAIEAAGKAMIEMGATSEMVDNMRDAANKGFSEAFEDDADASPVYWIIMAIDEIAPE